MAPYTLLNHVRTWCIDLRTTATYHTVQWLVCVCVCVRVSFKSAVCVCLSNQQCVCVFMYIYIYIYTHTFDDSRHVCIWVYTGMNRHVSKSDESRAHFDRSGRCRSTAACALPRSQTHQFAPRCCGWNRQSTHAAGTCWIGWEFQVPQSGF